MTDEQNKPVRSREEQAKALISRINDMTMDYPSREIPPALAEAEARGAAEQRRKDAEGQEAVAWCLMTSDQQIINGIHMEKCHAEDWKHRRASDTLTPLYTHPTNVAAQEARIAELEGAITALFDGQCVLENRGWGKNPDRIVLYDDEQMASGKDPVSVAVHGANSVRAALIKEGTST